MRGPSGRVLVNRANLYRLTGAQDADAGADPAASYGAAFASSVPCSAQCLKTVDQVDEAGRASSFNEWLFILETDYAFRLRDRIDVLAADGATVAHQCYAVPGLDAGGRGAVFEVTALERL